MQETCRGDNYLVDMVWSITSALIEFLSREHLLTVCPTFTDLTHPLIYTIHTIYDIRYTIYTIDQPFWWPHTICHFLYLSLSYPMYLSLYLSFLSLLWLPCISQSCDIALHRNYSFSSSSHQNASRMGYQWPYIWNKYWVIYIFWNFLYLTMKFK